VERNENTGDSAGVGTAAQGAAARLLICEPSGRWAVALRRELADAGVRVWETRTLAGCGEEIGRSPASFVILQMSDDVEGLLRFMTRLSREFPAVRLAVVADRSRQGYEWLMREAGAVDFVISPRQASRLARLACRHLAEVQPPQQSLTERIWAGLPWG
jgi:hypothetical protein